MLPTKIWFILISGLRREDSNVKNKQKTGDGRHVMAKARMAFRPSELKWKNVSTGHRLPRFQLK